MFENEKDERLIELSRSGDSGAEEALILRYMSYVRSFARPYFLAGGDSEDLIQEGMIGVVKAISEYDEVHHASFRTFAASCIRNRIYSAIRHSQRGKNSPLNNYISIEKTLNPNIGVDVPAVIAAAASDPVEQLISKESYDELIKTVFEILSGFEKEVLKLYLEGLSYAEISERVSKPQKSIDNAVQRIRRKFAQHLG